MQKPKVVLLTCLLPFLLTKGSRILEKKVSETRIKSCDQLPDLTGRYDASQHLFGHWLMYIYLTGENLARCKAVGEARMCSISLLVKYNLILERLVCVDLISKRVFE